MRNLRQITSVEEFGKRLVLTGDLDPIYIALNEQLETAQTMRWLVAYFCFYNAGVACWLSEFRGTKFWEKVFQAAENKQLAPCGIRWPRGAERRHFRGEAAEKAVRLLRGKYAEPEAFVKYLMGPGRKHRPFAEVSNRVQEHFLFGSWIAYKVGDILERVLRVPIDFSATEVFMYKEPARSALLLWEQGYLKSKNATNQQERIAAVVQQLLNGLEGLKAPPNGDRSLGVQEAETILCKFKAQNTGYYVGKDIQEIRHGLQPWLGYSYTARKFLTNLPQEVNTCPKLW